MQRYCMNGMKNRIPSCVVSSTLLLVRFCHIILIISWLWFFGLHCGFPRNQIPQDRQADPLLKHSFGHLQWFSPVREMEGDMLVFLSIRSSYVFLLQLGSVDTQS